MRKIIKKKLLQKSEIDLNDRHKCERNEYG